ncbi:MAG: aspartate kinase [Candidatus Thorarchaeota archaeon]|jgi:aspartate kinase
MKVMKFGGGCLRDSQGFRRVGAIVQSVSSNSLVVVVSAVAGITDMLANASEAALTSDAEIPQYVNDIRDIHHRITEEAIDSAELREGTFSALEPYLKKLERLLFGVAYTGELIDTVKILILSQGERLSAAILAAVFQDRGLSSEAFESDQIGIVTFPACNNATANLPLVRENLHDSLLPVLKRGTVPVVTGFFGCNPEGKTASFGRNGTDYSAAVIASALDVDEIDVWKDVDGFMTADPSLIPTAQPIAKLSYGEAAELSYFGARILHPRTTEPLVGRDVSIRIRNVHSPEGIGTVIARHGKTRADIIKSVTSNADIVVLRVHGGGVGYKPGIIGDIGQTLAEIDINIYSVITSQTCINLLLDQEDSQRAQVALRPLVDGVIERLELKEDVALIAVVGEGLSTTKGLAAKVFSAVAQSDINVEMISSGASEVAYYFIVRHEDMQQAIQAVHACFFETPHSTTTLI